MAYDPVANFVRITVNGTFGLESTVIDIIPGDCEKLPEIPAEGEEFNLTWYDSTNYSDPTDDPSVEIVRVMEVDLEGDIITVMRAQEGTPATIKATEGATYKMALSLSAKVLNDLRTPPGENSHIVLNYEDRFGSDNTFTYAEGALAIGGGGMSLNGTYVTLPSCSGPPEAPPGSIYYNGVNNMMYFLSGETWLPMWEEIPEP